MALAHALAHARAPSATTHLPPTTHTLSPNLLLASDGISGQDVFDSVGTVVGTVVDGVVQLKEDSGISNKDIFDAAGDLIGKVGEVAKAAADKFGLSDIDVRTCVLSSRVECVLRLRQNITHNGIVCIRPLNTIVFATSRWC